MKILVLSHEYPPIGGGGGKVAEDICEGLVKYGNQVKVITTHLKGLPAVETRSGVELIRLRSGRKFAYKASFSSMALYIATGFLRAMKEIREWKPDLIHVHFAVPAGVIGQWASFYTGVPYVLTAHLGDVPGGVPEKTDKWFRWVKPFTPPIWNNAAKIVAVSAFTRQLALQYYPVPIDVIPNGVAIDLYDPGPIKVNDPPMIVFAGRFVPQKNPIQLVQSLSDIQDLPWRAALVGDGALRPDVEAEIQKLGLQDRIELPGWLTPAEVMEWFRDGDILFMPSLSEGLPVTGVQAMAMGLAVIAGNRGGFIDLVEDGRNGYLFDPTDRQGFSDALRKVLSDRLLLLNMKQNSRQMSATFDLGNIVKQYQDVFSQIVAERNKAR
jgi:L-malate glycosyltransferase